MKRAPSRTGSQRIIFDPEHRTCHFADMTGDDLETLIDRLKGELDALLVRQRAQEAIDRTRH
jgi:hypothetical protein